MPLPFALLVGFSLGGVFAHAARGELSRHDGSLLGSRAAALVLGFAALVFAPLVGYFAAFHGDWAYLYLVPWRSVPSAVDLTLVLMAGGTVWVGFAVGAGGGGALRRTVLLLGAPLAIAFALAAVAARRLPVSASYAQFHGGFGVQPLTASPLGEGVLLAALALGAGTLWTVRVLRRSA